MEENRYHTETYQIRLRSSPQIATKHKSNPLKGIIHLSTPSFLPLIENTPEFIVIINQSREFSKVQNTPFLSQRMLEKELRKNILLWTHAFS